MNSDTLWHSYRKFANKTIYSIAKLLYERPLSFSNIKKATELSTNILNHNLIDMRNAHLVILDDIDKKYYLTQYGALLLESSENLKISLKDIDIEKLFSPINCIPSYCMRSILEATDIELDDQEGKEMIKAIIAESKHIGLSFEDMSRLFKYHTHHLDPEKFNNIEPAHYNCKRLKRDFPRLVTSYCGKCKSKKEPCIEVSALSA
jgi:predicted transcriptional regulator